MRAARKHRVRMRLKIRDRLAKRAGAAFAALAAGALAVYWGYRARSFVAAFRPLETFAFTLMSFRIESPSDAISGDISAMLAPRTGRRFSASDAKSLERALRRRYPALSRVEVGRNFIGGRVTVKAEQEPVVARVRLVSRGGGPVRPPQAGDGGDRGEPPQSFPSAGAGGGGWYYLAESGRLLPETYLRAPPALFETEIRAEPGENLSQLARFLKEAGGLRESFVSRPVGLRCGGSGGSCLMTLENGAEIFWGEFEFTRSKIARLNEVLEDAARKIKGPVKVNFRYFRDGKIFVSKAGGFK